MEGSAAEITVLLVNCQDPLGGQEQAPRIYTNKPLKGQHQEPLCLPKVSFPSLPTASTTTTGMYNSTVPHPRARIEYC